MEFLNYLRAYLRYVKLLSGTEYSQRYFSPTIETLQIPLRNILQSFFSARKVFLRWESETFSLRFPVRFEYFIFVRTLN